MSTELSPIQESINFEETFKYTALKLGLNEPDVNCYAISEQAYYCTINGKATRITKPLPPDRFNNEVIRILNI